MPISENANSKLQSIRTRIPQRYQRQPIISRLISRYGLNVNIAAALLESHNHSEGLFDLDLQGSPQQVKAGIAYLQELNVEIFKLKLKNHMRTRIEKSQEQDLISNSNVPPALLFPSTEEEIEGDLTSKEGQTTRTKFQVCIPKDYRTRPVIAELVSGYGLTINITSAILGEDAQADGWFDLELWGRRRQIVFGLRYLKQLNLQIWL